MPPELRQMITRSLFDIVKEHGPITISNTWERVQEVGLKDLTSKNHMKVVLRWMRERQKLRLVCNHVGAHKQFLYTTWFTKPGTIQAAIATPTTTTAREALQARLGVREQMNLKLNAFQKRSK
ncbi:unnamed protein product [Vicia faba]|uniref:Uncharacterized protein n=1 Tax=Vicia faba TaxID=3906 RepID=A0AAV1AIF1_VICFA|nr:unnamed protein product [Vicia faba]